MAKEVIPKNNLQIKIFSFSTKEEFKQLLDSLVNIYLNGYRDLEEYAYTHKNDIRSYLKWLYKIDPEVFLVATLGEKAIGFIAGCRYWQDRIYGEMGEVHELVVDKSFQRHGIGKELTKKILLMLEKYHNIVGLWVGERNKNAIRLYQYFGFHIAGQVGKWLRMIRKK
jgi:ribosomal protein S18 acetylase RimI-like enzyme